MRIAALSGAALLAALPALALAATPAPNAVTDWIDVSVEKVVPPGAAPGTCVLTGWVVTVRQSNRFQPGSPVSLNVPCGAPGVQAPYYDMAMVGRTKLASIKLSGDQVIGFTAVDSGTAGS